MTPWYDILLSIVELAESIAVLFLNVITMVAIIKYKLYKKSATNIFIASLTATDLVAGFSSWALAVQHLSQALHSNGSHVVILSWMSSLSGCFGFIASLVTTLFIGLDRVCHSQTNFVPANYVNTESRHMADTSVGVSYWLHHRACDV